MAQPLAKPDTAPLSDIDAAAARLEHAFRRLEMASARARAEHHSLRADREKLNRLLQETEEKMQQFKEVTDTVSTRLDHAIILLECPAHDRGTSDDRRSGL